MTDFEEKVNAYRENKRLMEELEAMNDAIKADIINMMHGAPEWYRAPQRPFIRTCRASGLIASFYRQCTRIFMLSAASAPHTSGSAWYKGVRQVVFSCILFFFWFFAALFKASK